MICAIELLQRAGDGFSRRTKGDFVLCTQEHHCKRKRAQNPCCDNPSNDSVSNKSKSAFSISVSGYFPLEHALRRYNTSKVWVPSRNCQQFEKSAANSFLAALKRLRLRKRELLTSWYSSQRAQHSCELWSRAVL